MKTFSKTIFRVAVTKSRAKSRLDIKPQRTLDITGLSPADQFTISQLVARLNTPSRWVGRFAYPEHGIKGLLDRTIILDEGIVPGFDDTIRGYDLTRQAPRSFKVSRIPGGRIKWTQEHVEVLP